METNRDIDIDIEYQPILNTDTLEINNTHNTNNNNEYLKIYKDYGKFLFYKLVFTCACLTSSGIISVLVIFKIIKLN